MRRSVLLLVLGALMVGCASPPPSAEPPVTPEVARAADAAPPFTFVFELPSANWRAGEAINGTVTLRVAEGGPSTVYGSGGGPFMFTYREVTGDRVVDPVATADCSGHPIAPDAPITAPLEKSGAWSDTDPDDAFIKAFLAGPDIRLPAGDWAVTVTAGFTDDETCEGRFYDLETTIVLHITD